jgi:hypothetical protein
MQQISIIERALQVAASGTCRTVEEIGRTLRQEGFADVDQHLTGPSFRRQLRGIMEAHKPKPD